MTGSKRRGLKGALIGMLRAAVILLTLTAALYVGAAALLWAFQSRFIYPAPQGEAAIPVGYASVSFETSDGLTLQAGYRPAEQGKPTLLYFHGNGGDWQSSTLAVQSLTGQGYGLLASEYRGYRGNPGAPTQEGLYRDARAAARFLASQGASPEQTVIVGNSIGSGPATQLATEITARALVLISPFASLQKVVSEQVPWLPVGLLLKDNYDNLAKIGSVGAPILIMHGDADTLIPHQHSEALANASGTAQLTLFAGAGHDLAWHQAAENRLAQFLAQLEPQQ